MPTSQAYKPSKKDDKKLSVYDGGKFTAEESHGHYVENFGESVGVVSILPSEAIENSIGNLYDNEPFEGHVSLDFSSLSNSQIEKAAKKLQITSHSRGWSFRPSTQ